MKSRIVIFLVLWVFLLGSCTEMVPLLSTQESELLVSFTNVPLKQANPGTKAIDATVDEGLANGYVVSDFWLFQYNEKGALIGKPRYYRTGGNAKINVSILKPTAQAVTYKAVFVANVHDNSFDTKIDCSTISALKATGIAVASSSDLYQLGYNDLLMSGVVDITSATTEIASCPLYRNVAKLNVNISNAADSGLEITSIQLRNVNNRLFYADCLYSGDDNGGQIAVPDASSVSFVDFELDEFNLDEGQNKSLTYYLTRNMRGLSDDVTSQKDKNQHAPQYSTYFEIMARHKVRGTSVRYRFYLGKNSTTDFNLEPNYAYTFNLTFKNMGSNDDLRVEDLGEVNLEDSNSYIIHPIQGNKGAKFIVPVKERINRFWNSEVAKVDPGANMDKYTEHIIGDGTEWVAEVIWQDVAGEQLIKFCMPDGSLTDTYTATGGDSFSFVLTDEAIRSGIKGNLLIGVRNAKQSWTVSDGYMWSWHLWLTDYNPDEYKSGWVDSKYAYQVTGGYVHKYPSFEGIPKYNGKFIMDRNIGATRHESKLNITAPEVRQASGMYYAYGRKDPFPSGKVYNIKGEQMSAFPIDKGPGTIHASVRRPYVYYKRDDDKNAGEDWASDVSLRSYDWNDLNKVARDGDNKSFFDPCPPGWHIPHSSIFTCYGAPKDSPQSGSYVYAANVKVRDWSSTTGNQFTEWGGWIMHLSGKEGYDRQTQQGGTWQYSPEHFIYFPGSDMRGHKDGSQGGSKTVGGLWLTNPSSGSAGYLYYQNSLNKEGDGLLFSFPRVFYRYLGFPVRCIKM